MVKQHVVNLLTQGVVGFGEKLPSEHSLMEQFNVSRNTIRQAFAELTSLGLIYKEQGRGTFSKYVPKNRNEKRIVAVMTTYISDYIFPDIILGIEEVLSAEGYSMLLSNTNNNKEKETQLLKNIIAHDVCGLIIEPTRSALSNINQPLFDELREKGTKIVFINATYPDLPAASVLLDDERGGFIATEYLLQLGHKRIAGIFIKDDVQGIKRRKGFEAALRQYEVAADPNLVLEYETSNQTLQPYLLAKSLLRQPNRPTAIFCYNDQIASMVMTAARDCDLQVPHDLSVVGFDDSQKALASDVKLTSVVHPKIEMGRRAAGFMIDMLDNGSDNPQILYRPELVVRDSCKNI
ncbi:MAG: GntR family transcriptional regulator [Clostridia bacterium]|nr:GntR family transcriptional regulator [Clostridia bacterium]